MQIAQQSAEAALGVKAKEEKAFAVKCKPVTSVWFQPMEYTHVGNLQTRILVLEVSSSLTTNSCSAFEQYDLMPAVKRGNYCNHKVTTDRRKLI